MTEEYYTYTPNIYDTCHAIMKNGHICGAKTKKWKSKYCGKHCKLYEIENQQRLKILDNYMVHDLSKIVETYLRRYLILENGRICGSISYSDEV